MISLSAKSTVAGGGDGEYMYTKMLAEPLKGNELGPWSREEGLRSGDVSSPPPLSFKRVVFIAN